MEDGDYLPPFWQPAATLTRRHRQQRRRPSATLNSSLIIIILPSLLLLFTVFIIIPFFSKILSPNINNNNVNNPVVGNTTPQAQKSIISVKKGWDSVNIVLVVVAILCGIFAKRNDDVPATPERGAEAVRNHNDLIQQAASTTTPSYSSDSVLLQRSKSVMMQPSHQWIDQYSHQQQISSPFNDSPTVTANNRLRRTVSSDPYMKFTGNSQSQFQFQFQFFDDLDDGRFYPKEEPHQPPVKDIPVDSFVAPKSEELLSPTISPPQTPPPQPPTPPPPPPAKQRRTFQAIPRKERAPPPPSPPPPPPRPPCGREEKKRSSRKRTTKDIASAIVSLYNQGKRKRRQKSSRYQEPRFSADEIQSQFIPPSPPPPPPPPPPVFHNWFKKGSKTNKVNFQSTSTTPTPPAPPKPPLPKRRAARGSESPNSVIPPAPPFKVGEMKFAVVGGGYVNVKVRSGESSPERVTCPSPDVNLKADTFIARHHSGWRLEKLNSWREKLNNGGHGPTV